MAFLKMEKLCFPAEVVEGIKDSVECNLYFYSEKVSIGAMYGVMTVSIAVLIGGYVLLSLLRKKD